MVCKLGRSFLAGLILVIILGGVIDTAGDDLGNGAFMTSPLASNAPDAEFTFSPESPMMGQLIQFVDQSSDSDGEIEKWRWDFGDGTICPPDCGSGSEQNPTHKYVQEGRYLVILTVTDDDDLVDTFSQWILVESQPPTADFEFFPTNPEAGELIQFNNRSSDPDGQVIKWQWDFGDGTACPPDCGSGTERNPTHQYSEDGEYQVRLTVTDSDDLIATLSKEITVGQVRMPVLITGGIAPDWGLYEYTVRDVNIHFERGETIILSSLPNGSGDIFVHTTLDIKVTHPDGTIAGRTIEFCDVLCICGSKSPLDLTSMFEPGKNRVSVTLVSKCPPPITSTELRLVRYTRLTPSRLIATMTREITQLQREAAKTKSSWNTSRISRELWRALRYATFASYRPRLEEIAQNSIDNAIELIEAIDFGILIDQVKEGLPEIRAEIEVLLGQNEAVEGSAKEMLNEIGDLYKLLCGLDPTATDCKEIMPITPVRRNWPQIESKLEQVVELLRKARDIIPDPQALQMIIEARGALPPPLQEIDEDWQQVDECLGQIRRQIRLLYRDLRRASRYSVRAENRAELSFALYPNLISSKLTLKLEVESVAVKTLEIQVFGLDGKLVLDKSAGGNKLKLSLFTDNGQPLANGVYLYVVTARGWDGSAIRSKVRKLVILR